MADERTIAVVGGGITGLAAARAAVLRGREVGRSVRVAVLERAGRFGGNILTERVDGFVLDAGPDSWVVNKPHATGLARALGLGEQLIGTTPENRRYYVAWDHRLHPVPEGLVLGVPTRIAPLVRTQLFTWRGKARMALEPLVPPRRLEGDEDESIADFATRRLGREAAERLVAPLLGGISAGDASDLSMRAAFPQLVAMEQTHGSLVRAMRAAGRGGHGTAGSRPGGGSAFTSLEAGTEELVRALVDQLQADGVTMHRGASVEALSARGAGGYSVRFGAEGVLEADAVLLAIPAHAAANLVAALDEGAARVLSSIPYASTATVFFGYRREDVAHPLDGVGFVVPRASGRPILAGTWVSSKWRGRAPEGHVLLRAFFGGAAGEEILGSADDELVRVARSEIRALMGIDAEPRLTRVFRFARASAQMRVGHLPRMREVRERLASRAPGLLVAGGGYDGFGIPDCIRQGEDAARALVG
jgi:oxygen-dependent protoporphyrinogen oxidase